LLCPDSLLLLLLLLSGIQLVNQEKRPDKVVNSRRVRARWQLLYTLVNNPSLLGSRKHYQLQVAH
jgi:protein-S-isoprenylcysteine O-methyltransferase Ste14